VKPPTQHRRCYRIRVALRTVAAELLFLALVLGSGWLVAEEQPHCSDEPCQAGGTNAESGNPDGQNDDTPKRDSAKSKSFLHKSGGSESPSLGPRSQTWRRRPRSSRGREESEFQRFVYSSIRRHLPLYGTRAFEDVPTTFSSLHHVPVVPSDYSIGAGDELRIEVWGQVNLFVRPLVDRNGQIFIPRVGVVTVAGVRYSQLQGFLTSQFSRIFRNFSLNVSLARLRYIQVFVAGRAQRPGKYTVSSLSTLINAVFTCGGPAANGSMRVIQLRRGNQVVTEMDLYDFLSKGDGARDVPLAEGDVIYFPPAGKMTAIAGSVQQPAIYELRGPTTLEDALRLAGGLTTTADTSSVMLERIGSDHLRHVEQFPLDSEALARPLQGGDLLRVYPVSPRFENAVTLRGNVSRPGRYPWHEGMRVSDLIPSPEAIVTPDYWLFQNSLGGDKGGWLAGFNRHSPKADTQPADVSNSGTKTTALAGPWSGKTDARHPEATPGETRTERRTDFSPNRAEINWDYAVVQRLNQADLKSQLLSFNLGQALKEPASPDNLLLAPGDVVTIFSQADVEVPLEKRAKYVWIEGEVKTAGVYRAEAGETLRDILARAGGLTPQAYLFAADFRRESTRQAQQSNLERMLDQMERDLRSKASRLATSPNSEERQAGRDEVETERTALARLRGTRPTGRVVLGLQPSDNELESLPALPLEDGDRITIPAKSATVAVAGAVYNQNSFLYRAGKGLKDYLRQSGGPTREADSARLFVIRADGSVVSKQMHHSLLAGRFEALKLMPGDTVVLPEKIRSGSLLRGIRDWSQVFSQFALGAAAIRVISP